jgi:ankyrin repeat protein
MRPFVTCWARPDAAAGSSNHAPKKERGRPFCGVGYRTPYPSLFPQLTVNPLYLIRVACEQGDVEAMQRMFPDGPTEWRDPQGCSLLHRVVQTPHVPMLNWLLTFPLNVSTPTPSGHTPLMWVCLHRNEAMVRRLLDHGSGVHAPNLAGRTALHCACSHEWVDGVALLLERGADPEARDERGRLPEDRLSKFSPRYATLLALLDAARHGCGLK